jgi:hypothetical protein
MEQSQNQKYLVIGLAVVALVLAGVIAYLVIGSNSSANPASPATTGVGGMPQQQAQVPPQTGGATGGGAMGGATGGNAGAAPQAPADFDPKTATKVPANSDPKKFVEAYYASIMKDDYKTAFAHLPADKQTGSSPDALKTQIEGYGVTGYKIVSAAQQGDQYTVNADQQTSSYGTFSNTWVFVKNGNAWVLQSKAVTGMK